MKDSLQDETYAFVSYDGSKLPENPKVRDLIRHRAMKHTAAIRKRGGGYGKHNVSQLPAWLLEPDVQTKDRKPSRSRTSPESILGCEEKDVKSAQVTARAVQLSVANNSCCKSLSPTSAPSFMIAMPQNYPLLNLASPLTVLHLGISTLSYFRSDFSCMGEVLSKMPLDPESRSLLSFIPSRYGHVSSITHATDCLIARLGQMVQGGGKLLPEGDLAVLKPYSRALRSLQEAIDDENLRMMPETLCAAELLGIFELLNRSSGTDAWVRHAGGAARLIELRGPDRFRTDFELSLFMAHAGPIVTEALLKGKTCFLEGERWQQIIRAAVHNDPLIPANQAPLVIKLWEGLGKGPNLFKEVEDLIVSPRGADSPPAREDLIKRLLQDQANLRAWRVLAEQYEHRSSGAAARAQNPPFAAAAAAALWRNDRFRKASPEHSITYRVLQGTYLLCSLIKTRLLYALAPSRFRELEAACQAIAREVMGMTTSGAAGFDGGNLLSGLFMSEVVWMAKAVMQTRLVWSEGLPGKGVEPCREDSGMIEKRRFEAWCTAIGRKIR